MLIEVDRDHLEALRFELGVQLPMSRLRYDGFVIDHQDVDSQLAEGLVVDLDEIEIG